MNWNGFCFQVRTKHFFKWTNRRKKSKKRNQNILSLLPITLCCMLRSERQQFLIWWKTHIHLWCGFARLFRLSVRFGFSFTLLFASDVGVLECVLSHGNQMENTFIGKIQMKWMHQKNKKQKQNLYLSCRWSQTSHCAALPHYFVRKRITNSYGFDTKTCFLTMTTSHRLTSLYVIFTCGVNIFNSTTDLDIDLLCVCVFFSFK